MMGGRKSFLAGLALVALSLVFISSLECRPVLALQPAGVSVSTGYSEQFKYRIDLAPGETFPNFAPSELVFDCTVLSVVAVAGNATNLTYEMEYDRYVNGSLTRVSDVRNVLVPAGNDATTLQGYIENATSIWDILFISSGERTEISNVNTSHGNFSVVWDSNGVLESGHVLTRMNITRFIGTGSETTKEVGVLITITRNQPAVPGFDVALLLLVGFAATAVLVLLVARKTGNVFQVASPL